MKSFFKLFLVVSLSAGVTIFINHFFFTPEKQNLEAKQNLNLIPTTYAFKSKTAAETTDFVLAASKTLNTVVHIKNTSSYDDEDQSLWSRFYHKKLYNDPKKVGSGSGVIVTPDGYIITNNHVIEDHTEIEVTLNDNKSYSATLIGTDPATDIAVIKIDAEKSLPFIAFGDSDAAKVGEWVLAVGNPFNLNSTVTAGIISAKSRDLNNYDRKNESFIQTDAAVNMGNSGGALVNTNGELIGINTAISSFTGGFVGYSFAVPSNIARKVFEDIIEFGNVQKGLLGIRGGALDSSVAENYDIIDTEGFYISEVEPDMGADLAGLTKGDIIKKVDDVVIRKFADLSGYLSTKRPGDKVKVTYKRERKTIETFVTLKKINKVSFLGMELQPLNDQQRKNLGLDQNENGVIISKAQNGASYYYGIDEGYAILEINEKKINQLDDVKNISVEDLKSILVVNPDGEKERILFNKYIR